jgi:BASS family bile acid:Na+ symporter
MIQIPHHTRTLSLAALVCGLIFAGAAAAGYATAAGWLTVLMFLILSWACTGSERFRSGSYTMIILALVCLAMFYPAPLQGWGEFRFQRLIVPLLQIIMFSVGSQMSLKDFEGVVRMPKAVFVGLVAQFSIMPLLGFTLAKSFPLAPEIAAGMILVGCSPTGLASNVMVFLARANLALAVTLTACATTLAPVLTPALMKLLAGQFVPIDFWSMMADIVQIVIYPIMAGLMFNALAYGKVSRTGTLRQAAAFLLVLLLIQSGLWYFGGQTGAIAPLRLSIMVLLVFVLAPLGGYLFGKVLGGRKEVLDRVLGYMAMVGIGVILTVITAAGRDSLLTIGLWLAVACIIHNIGGYVIGYTGCRLLGMDERSCRTIALEVGQQNGGLASGIAVQMGKAATLGLAPAVFGALQNVTGSALATWWRRIPVKDDPGAAGEPVMAGEPAAAKGDLSA